MLAPNNNTSFFGKYWGENFQEPGKQPHDYYIVRKIGQDLNREFNVFLDRFHGFVYIRSDLGYPEVNANYTENMGDNDYVKGTMTFQYDGLVRIVGGPIMADKIYNYMNTLNFIMSNRYPQQMTPLWVNGVGLYIEFDLGYFLHGAVIEGEPADFINHNDVDYR